MTKKLIFIVIVALLTATLIGSSLALSSSRGMKHFSATIGSPDFLEPNPANMKTSEKALLRLPNLKPGWPSPVMCAERNGELYASANSQPYFIKVNGQTKTIIRDPYYIYIYNPDGTEFTTIDDPSCKVISAWESLVAVSDIDNDGKEEIVINCNYNPNGAPASFKIYGFDSQGNPQLESVIEPFGNEHLVWLRQDGAATHFVIDDIDNDGVKEIIVLAKVGTQSDSPVLAAFHADGSFLPGFPTDLVEGSWNSGSMKFGSITVGRVYPVSTKHIVTVHYDGQHSIVQIFNKDGTVSKTIGNLDGNGALFGGVVMADVNRDRYKEIALVTTTKNYLIHSNGNILFAKNDPKNIAVPASFVDRKMDRKPEIVFMGDHKVTIYSAGGSVLRTIPTDWYWGPASLSAPVDSAYGYRPQLIFTDTVTLKIVNPISGVTAFEVPMNSWSQSPAVYDMDDDGKSELIMNLVVDHPTYGWGPCTQTYVWDLSTPRFKTANYWPLYFQNNQNTGSMDSGYHAIKVLAVD